MFMLSRLLGRETRWTGKVSLSGSMLENTSMRQLREHLLSIRGTTLESTETSLVRSLSLTSNEWLEVVNGLNTFLQSPNETDGYSFQLLLEIRGSITFPYFSPMGGIAIELTSNESTSSTQPGASSPKSKDFRMSASSFASETDYLCTCLLKELLVGMSV